MIELRPRETVILAVDFARMVAWYQETLGFELLELFEDDFHYAVLATPSGIKIGIAVAGEVGAEPGDRSKNTTLLQVEVDDVADFFAHLEKSGGATTFGPSLDEKGKFWFGGFADIEENPFWVVDKNCP